MRRLPLFGLLVALTTSPVGARDDDDAAPRAARARLAGIADEAPRLLLNLANRAIPGRIDAQVTRFDAPSTVVLEGVTVRDPEGREVARVKRITADAKLSALLAGDIVIERLLVVEPWLPLAMREGRLNLLRAFLRDEASTSERPDIDVYLNAVVVEDGALTFDDGTLTARADGLSAQLKAELFVASGHFVVRGSHVRVRAGRVDLPEVGVPLSDVRANDFAFRATRLTLGQVTGAAMGAAFRASGDVYLTGAGRFDVKGSVDAPAAAWPEKLARLPFATPKANASGSLSGTFGAPLVILSVSSEESFVVSDIKLATARASVVVTRQSASFADGVVSFAGGGTATAEGTFHIREKTLLVDASVDRVPIATALAPARLAEPPTGQVSGAVRVEGATAGPFVVRAGVRARKVKGFGLTSAEPLDVTAVVVVREARVDVESALVESRGLSATASGSVDTKQKLLSLDVEASAESPERFLVDAPKDLSLGNARFVGQLGGSSARPRVAGVLSTRGLVASGVGVDVERADITVEEDVVRVTRVTGRVLDGAMSGEATITLGKRRTIGARASVVSADGALYRTTTGNALPIAGRFDASANVDGSLDDPRVRVTASSSDVHVSGERLGALTLVGSVTKDRVVIEQANVHGGLADARVTSLRIDPRTGALEGSAVVDHLDLSRLAAAERARLAGSVSGPVRVSGTLDAPSVVIDVTLANLSIDKSVLGDGHGTVRVVPDRAREGALVVDWSTFTRGPSGRIDARGAYALDTRRINARVDVAEVELAPFTRLLGEEAPRIDGVLTGSVEARGVIDDPNVRFSLVVPETTLHPADEVEAPPLEQAAVLARTRTRGRSTLTGSLVGGQLRARLCAFESASAKELMTACERPARLFADVRGPIDPATGAFDLAVDAAIVERDLAVLVPALRRAALEVSGQARADVDVRRAADGAVDVAGLATFEELVLAPNDAPTARLTSPAFVRFTSGTVALEKPMTFEVGERTVRLSGQVDLEARTLAASLRGEVALAMVALFTNEVTQPTGSLDARVAVAGPFEAPVVDGCVAPKEGAAFTSRALGRRLEFMSGDVCVAPDDESSSSEALERVSFQRLVIGVDDGRAVFGGDVTLALESEDPQRVRGWNLALEGQDLVLGSGRTWADFGYDVTLRGEDAPTLAGRVEVREGALRETFELANFVVTKKPGRPRAPLHETLRPFGLDDLALDVDIAITSFETAASASSVRVDGTVRGDLHLAETVRVPVLTGAIDVADGRFQFPFATFDVEQSQIEFVRRSDGRLVPRLYLVARTELEPPRNGLDTEVPVVLSLDGDLDQMQLDLHAEDTDLDISQNALFRYVLFGAPLSSTERSADASGALRAVSSELTSAFTRDIERTFSEELGTDVQLQVFYDDGRVSGGVRYALGRRLEIEGEAGILGQTTDANAPATTGELRLRLLVLDHMPLALGRHVAFVGQVKSPSGTTASDGASSDMRLTYRIFEF